MAIKANNGTAFDTVTAVKIHNGESFADVARVNACVNGEWQKIYPTSQTLTKTYSLSDAEIYWGTGGKETDYQTQLIVGSYGGTKATARRTLMFFPISQIMEDLAGAQIVSVELYLKRLDVTHGGTSCNTVIKLHGYSSPPARWDDGPDLGSADSGTPTFTRGQGKWVTLLNSVGEGLRDGIIKGVCLDADANYDISRYGRFSRSSARLRITYTKEG